MVTDRKDKWLCGAGHTKPVVGCAACINKLKEFEIGQGAALQASAQSTSSVSASPTASSASSSIPIPARRNLLGRAFDWLLGQKSSRALQAARTGPAQTKADVVLYARRLQDHLNRVSNCGAQYAAFVRDYFPPHVVSMLATAASEKMALTQSDHKEHSFCMSQSPISYWICTVPGSIDQARSWFMKSYGGYSKLLERIWNSELFRVAGCEVLVHIVYRHTGSGIWVNMTIFPVGSTRFSMKPILPVDLLTEAEIPL